MTPITNDMWRAYRLTHQEGLSHKEAAEKMGVTESVVKRLLFWLKSNHPDLFVDISSDGRRFDHGVSRYGSWCDGEIKEKF